MLKMIGRSALRNWISLNENVHFDARIRGCVHLFNAKAEAKFFLGIMHLKES
jgi:hypothetical protein